MKDFAKYLTPSDDDRHWGLYLNVAGRSKVPANSSYPIPNHPAGYFFTWEKWRTLREFQINYIESGSGMIETENGQYQIKSGMLILIWPGMKHRYRPNTETGWVENYVGFNGAIAEHLLQNEWFNVKKPLIDCGYKGELIDSLLKIFELVQNEKPGYQQVASGMIIKLLGYIVSFEKQRGFIGKPIEKTIEKIRFTMRAKVDEDISIEQLAQDFNLGYSYFRKMFKRYTGMAPHQYQLELKLIRAKELLLSTDRSIKEISFDLGFQSIHYFSRLFKNRTGISPSEYRTPKLPNP